METRSLLLTLAVASVLSAAGAAVGRAGRRARHERMDLQQVPVRPRLSCRRRARRRLRRRGLGEVRRLHRPRRGGRLRARRCRGPLRPSESGYVLSYELNDLGLDSREVRFEGGKQGALRLRACSTTASRTRSGTPPRRPYGGNGSTDLTLPAGWVDGGSTGGMTSLDGSLRSVDVGFDRDRYGAARQLLVGARTCSSRSTTVATSATAPAPSSARSAASSTQVLTPVDDATDRWTPRCATRARTGSLQVRLLRLVLRHQGRRRCAGTTRSRHGRRAATWARWRSRPTTTTTSSAFRPAGTGLPWQHHAGVLVRLGQGHAGRGLPAVHDQPDSSRPTPLPARNLDGEMSVTRADLTVTSRPIDRLRLRGSVAYDERDNDTRQRRLHFDRAHRPVPGARRPRESGVRLRAPARARQRGLRGLRQLSVGAGGEYRELDRTGTEQEVTQREPVDGWGARAVPAERLPRHRAQGRRAWSATPDDYDTDVARRVGQNPLLRKYNMAYLYRSYGEVVVNVAFGSLPLTLGANGYYGDDSYNSVGDRRCARASTAATAWTSPGRSTRRCRRT